MIVTCYFTIDPGTMFGGWRIVRTLGQKIIKIKPVDGFCTKTSGAITLFLTTSLGIPVSTSHTITDAIVVVGLTPVCSALDSAETVAQTRIFVISAPRLVTGICYRISLIVLRS